MKRILSLLSFVLAISCTDIESAPQQDSNPVPKYRHILLRDFRTVYNGEIISYNIGTAAHGPSTLNVLQKYLPDDVDITIWATEPLDSTLSAMMRKRFPDVKIVSGSYSKPSEAPEDLRKAIEESDLFLVSSGSGISVGPSLEDYRNYAGKSIGAYAVGYSNSEDEYLKWMDFAWFRDEISSGKAKTKQTTPAINGWAPDAVFDFDCIDEPAALEFMKQHNLEDGKFTCCIPGFRYTPRWEFYGSKVNEKQKATNEEYLDRDNGILRRTIIETVRNKGIKVLICAEQIPEVRLCKEIIYDKLPEDVKPYCTYIDKLWSPDLALGVYRHSLCVYGIEMHSQVMAAGNGIPAAVFRHSGFGNKSDMWNTVGLGDWLLDIDDENASDRASAIISSILDNPEAASAKLTRAREIIDSANRTAIDQSFFVRDTPEQGSLVGFQNPVKRFTMAGVSPLVYYGATKALEEGDDASVAVIAVHGYGGGVHQDFSHSILMDNIEDSFVITPLFASVRVMERFPNEADGRALWGKSWADRTKEGIPDDDWRGGGDAEGTEFSSFDVIDRMVEILSSRKLYPNLKRIVISGFSAGGQFVDRYAAVGKAKPRRGISIDYLSMSPSTNLYLNKDVIWHYGLSDRPRYCRNLSEKIIYRNLCHRRVLHVCGGLDTSEGVLDMTAPAMLQGKNRLDRFYNYREYVSGFPGWKSHTMYYVIDSIAHEAVKAYMDPVITRYIQTGEF